MKFKIKCLKLFKKINITCKRFSLSEYLMQIAWEHNEKACWPTSTLILKPNQTQNKLTNSVQSNFSSSADAHSISQSIDCLDALLDDFANIGYSQSSFAAGGSKRRSKFAPKICCSQPTFGAERRDVVGGSQSTPSLSYQDHNACYSGAFSTRCMLCKKIKKKSFKRDQATVTIQSLRSKSQRSDIWRVSNVYCWLFL